MTRPLRISAWAFVAFPFAVIMVFTVIPTILGVVLSLFVWDGGAAPQLVGLKNYGAALTGDPQLWLSLRNTILFTLGSAPATVLLSFVVAVALHAQWFKGRTLVRTLVFLPTVMSIVAVGFVWQWLLNPRAGLLSALPGTVRVGHVDFMGDTWLGLGTLVFVQIWRNLGFFVVLYVAALSRVPRSTYEAAGVDGANPWQVMWYITWPAVWPMTSFLTLISIIWSLQVFDLDLVMTGWSPQRYTDMINTHLNREFKNDRLG